MDPIEYTAVFNAAVASGDWSSLVERFTDNASLEFVGPPVGPFVGRAAIADAYEQSPPDDTIEITDLGKTDGAELVVGYRWQTGGTTGSMRFTERDGLVSRLVVTFD